MRAKRKIKKIMLGIPNTGWFGRKWDTTFPYTLGLLAAALKGRYEVAVLDANIENLSQEEVAGRISSFEPDVFGISRTSMASSNIYNEMIRLIKHVNSQTIIIEGGVYPTILPEECMNDQNIDYAILGEGEYRLPTILEHLENDKSLKDMDGVAYREMGKLIVQPVKEYIGNLDKLPFPAYDEMKYNLYSYKANKFSSYYYPKCFPYAVTVSSRGCPFNCVFCNSKAVCGPGIRFRSAKNVLNEIDWLVKEYGIKEIVFMDDNFFANKMRVKEIIRGLISRNYDLSWKAIGVSMIYLDGEILELMRQSGGYQLVLAIESGTEKGLKLLNKPLLDLNKFKVIIKKAKELGFELSGSYVIGIPGETWDDIRATFRFAEDLDIDYSYFNIATPLPHTELYNIVKKNELLVKGFSFSSFESFGKGVIITDEFTPELLQVLRAYEWDRINFKTEEQKKRVAKMNGITLEELEKWRKETLVSVQTL